MYITNESKEDAVSPVIGVMGIALSQILLQLFWRQDFIDVTDGRNYSNLGGSHSCLRIRYGRKHPED